MNKLIKLLVVNIAILLGAQSVLAAESNVEAVKRVSQSDQFLSFVLSKAEKYSEKGEDAIGKAVDAIASETPKIIEEFIKYRIFIHLWKTFVFVPFIIFGYFFARKLIKVARETNSEDITIASSIGAVVTIILSLISGGLLAKALINDFPYAIQAMIAPRVYIIEQAIELMK